MATCFTRPLRNAEISVKDVSNTFTHHLNMRERSLVAAERRDITFTHSLNKSERSDFLLKGDATHCLNM